MADENKILVLHCNSTAYPQVYTSWGMDTALAHGAGLSSLLEEEGEHCHSHGHVVLGARAVGSLSACYDA